MKPLVKILRAFCFGVFKLFVVGALFFKQSKTSNKIMFMAHIELNMYRCNITLCEIKYNFVSKIPILHAKSVAS